MWPAVEHVEGRMRGPAEGWSEGEGHSSGMGAVELAALLFRLHGLSGVCGRKCGM